nr:hypothetical protein AALP_AAs48002U000400 [Ipomoea batatas]GMC66042.1 hypothetical protein AALP_AAs48002U000400 [Ipomoea batatas]
MLPISNGRQLVAEDDSRRVGPEGVVTWRVWISRELDRNGDEDEEQQKAVKVCEGAKGEALHHEKMCGHASLLARLI